MTLKKLLETLKTKNVLVTVFDDSENEICKIYADGIDALDDTLEKREVSKWYIKGAAVLEVIVGEVIEDTQTEPDTTNP